LADDARRALLPARELTRWPAALSLSARYDGLILQHPMAVLLLIAALVAVSAWQARSFRLDASSDSLLLEEDESLRYYRTVRARYGSDDFLIVTYTPAAALFDPETLADLGRLRDELSALKRVDSVTSILDVPLIRSPPVSLSELQKQVPTLESPGSDKTLARQELLTSPLYRNLLISPDGGTTALQINLHRSTQYSQLLERRSALREERLQQPLSSQQRRELAGLTQQIKRENSRHQGQLRQDVKHIRAIMDSHRDAARLHLGGVPMIVADSIGYIRHDLIVFGAGVVLFLVIILTIAFRKPRWVVLPLLTCGATGVVMTGLLGLLDWPVTVVSANFLALLLIITLSLTIHLMVRYRELHALRPQADQYQLVRDTVHSKAMPCFYTAITTMVAFGSLLVSGVRPVIDFGWMMTLGIAVAFVLSFTLFPCAALCLAPGQPAYRRDLVQSITGWAARLVERHGNATLGVFAVLAVFGVVGISFLSVENRFIDYFKASTEIHQGMELIDRELGGTTPLDVIVDAPSDFGKELARNTTNGTEEDAFADAPYMNDADIDSGGITATSYWFNSFRFDRVAGIHASLDQFEATGKVLSIDTTLRMLHQLKGQDDFDNFFLSILYKKLPDTIRAQLIEPYMSQDGNQLRFSVRVFESDPTLDRDRLLSSIRQRLTQEQGLDPAQLHLTGMLVLYNNMLHSLFRSQLLTAGVVFIAILLMFTLLFRNLRLALVAIVPNIFAAGLVLGLMGWLGVSLDLMTITIAAISIGIAVDDTIHYVHRYRNEFDKDRDYLAAMTRAHASIGRALFYTTLTITLGFSILTLSSFVPTIYFGLFTGIAMLTALAADMTLLPLLIVRCKVLGNTATTQTT
jgi:predicted RND superfamily exporter protein